MSKYSIIKNFIIHILLFIIIICTSQNIQANNIKNSAVIFMYHKFDVGKYPTTNIKIAQFKNHLEELSKSKYNVKSLSYIVDSIINDEILPPNTVGLSVDDGDKSFLEVGWPLFKEKGFPVTLFLTTGAVGGRKNSLSWDDIRRLKSEGVTIGAHSHTHPHLPNMDISQLKDEIEKSNRIYLKEINEIPSLFAYPYGETSSEIIDLIKNYKFKAAFGQHSGVINETSNFYYLPRFSLNEKYGDIERFRFSSQLKGLGVYDFIPVDPHVFDNPPFIGFSLLDEKLVNKIECFIFDKNGRVNSDLFKFNERIEIRLNRKLEQGRSRLNCTTIDQNNKWRWFGHQFYISEN